MEKTVATKKRFLDSLYRHPWLICAVCAAVTVFAALQIPGAELDNNNIRFVPRNDTARLTSEYIDDTFGSSSFILVALERKYGDVFDPAFLNRIREFNARVGEIEAVGEINSIVSSDYIYAEGDAIVVRKLAGEDFTGTPGESALLKQRVLSWDIYRRALVSDDFSAVQILIPLDITGEAASRPEMIDRYIEIRDIANGMFKGYAEVYVAGLPILSTTINEAMRADLVLMIPLVTLVVLLVLFFSFRSFAPVILPLLTVAVAVVWSVGAMPLLGVKLSVISSVLPVILVAVGSAYGIHVVTHYLEEAGAARGMGREEHRELVTRVVRKIGKAVSLAALTTLAGFSSFCFTPVLPIREFGFFSTFGVVVSFLAALTLIPALLIIRGPRPVKSARAGGSGQGESRAALFFYGIARRRAAVLFCAACIVLLSVWGVSKVVTDNVFIEYFKAGTAIARSDRFIREKFGGTKVLSVVVEAGSTERLLMPGVLGALDSLGVYLEEKVPGTGKVMGFTDLIKRVNQVFNADESPGGIEPAARDEAADGYGSFGFADLGSGFFDDGGAAPPGGLSAADAEPAGNVPEENGAGALSAVEMIGLLREAAGSGRDRSMDAAGLVREMEKLVNYGGAAYYEIPRDPSRYGKTTPEELSRLTANYLVLLSGDISSYANDPLSPTAIKNTVQLRTVGDKDTALAVNSIHAFVRDNFPPDVTVTVGGSAMVESSLNRLVVQSQLSSVIFSVLMVFAIVAVSNRSLIAGLAGTVPLSISVLINFAVMGFMGIKLNLGTSMVASVSVGIGIDYTIHYMEAYKREYLAGDGGAFLLRTFAASGKAILINAVSVGAGFAVLLFSQFVMLKDLGLLIAITMGSSALVSLTVIPALLQLIRPGFIRAGG